MGARLFLFLALGLVAGCSDMPVNGCLIAAANQREVLRARAYLHPAIPARVLHVDFAGHQSGHALLVFRLHPEGWFVYDDTFGSRHLPGFAIGQFPDPLAVAHEALPARRIADAHWLAPGR